MRELLHRYKTVQSTRYWVFSGRWKCLAYMVVQRPTFFTHRLQAVRFPQTRAELRRGVCVSRAGQCGAGRAGPNSVLTSPSGANAIAFIIDIAHVVAAFFPPPVSKKTSAFLMSDNTYIHNKYSYNKYRKNLWSRGPEREGLNLLEQKAKRFTCIQIRMWKRLYCKWIKVKRTHIICLLVTYPSIICNTFKKKKNFIKIIS